MHMNNKLPPNPPFGRAPLEPKPVDPNAPTRPYDPNASYTPDPFAGTDPTPMDLARLQPVVVPSKPKGPSRRFQLGRGCCSPYLLTPLILAALAFLVYMLFPGRTTILVLGIDARPDEGVLGRSDTNVIASFDPIRPYVGMLSIPRDLFVTFSDGSQNRINTAHFFAEANEPGSGPRRTIEEFEYVLGTGLSFDFEIDYYIRLRFAGFAEIVDAMGGIDVTFEQDMSGYTAGTHHLDGTQALALVRDRAGSDDFARMRRAQLFFTSAVRQMLKPASWPRLPLILAATAQAVDTNIPPWQYPRIALALLRAGADGIDSRTIDRSMATGYTTDQGANVLLPNWEIINPVLEEMFNK